MKKTIFLLIAILCAAYIGAEPQNGVVYVKAGAGGDGSSWENAMGDIQAAIAKAKEDDAKRKDVWVAGGNFTLTENISMQDSVNVYGSFAGTESSLDERAKVENGKAWEFVTPTTLTGNGCRLVNFSGQFDIPTIMDGFILTGGNAADNSTVAPTNGGAVSMRNNGVLQNCIVKNNKAENGTGGGIHTYGGPIIRYCLIKDNVQKVSAAGGGGIYCNTSSLGVEAFIENCEITGNTSNIRGAGLGIQGNSIIHVNNCIIYNNTAIDGTTLKPGGGIYTNGTNNQIINNIVYNNTGTNAIYLQTGKFINNTVVKNIGGIYLASGTASGEIKNNIVWSCATDATGNTATSITGVAVSGMAVQNNATYNSIPLDKGWNTSDNIQFSSNWSNGDVSDPQFGVGSGPKFVKVSSFFGAMDASQLEEEDIEALLLDLDSANWSLNYNSPCVNKGQNIDYVTSDILDENRPQGFPFDEAKTDIGAYELPYYLVVFDAYDEEKGKIYDENGEELTSEHQLGFAKGEEFVLYFISESGTAPYKVSITRSNNGGLTFDGEVIDITDKLNEDGLWTDKAYFPFLIKVEWDKDDTSLREIDGNTIHCFGIKGAIELKGLTIGENLSVYDTRGSLVKSIKITNSDLNLPLQTGLYIVRIDNAAKKVTVR